MELERNDATASFKLKGNTVRIYANGKKIETLEFNEKDNRSQEQMLCYAMKSFQSKYGNNKSWMKEWEKNKLPTDYIGTI